jgi:hypothetical protein
VGLLAAADEDVPRNRSERIKRGAKILDKICLRMCVLLILNEVRLVIIRYATILVPDVSKSPYQTNRF